MSHSVDENQETIRTAEPPVLGRLLQEARESLGLSVEEVSNRLRLSSRQIKALESDDFAVLPEAMITRGFIRNYARLLEIDAEPLLEAYRAYVPSEPPRAISIQSENILISGNDSRSWLVYAVGSALIVILLGVWLYVDNLPQRQSQSEAAVPDVGTPESAINDQPSESIPIPALPPAERMGEDMPAVDGTTAGGEAIVQDMAQDAAPAEQPIPAPQSNAAASTSSMAVLRLMFSEQTWVSVIDGNNEEILNKTKSSGTEEIIEGKPPLKVVIGNAAGSKLVYNGTPVDLEPHTRLNVARITLE